MTDSRNVKRKPEVPGQIGWLDDEAANPSPEIGPPEVTAPSSENPTTEDVVPPVPAPWSIPKSASPQFGRGFLIMVGVVLLATVVIIGLVLGGALGIPGSGRSGAASSLSPDTYGLDLTTLCTGGATELIITGPDGVDQHVKCP